MPRLPRLLARFVVLALATPAVAQPPTSLREVLRRTDERAFGVRGARGMADARQAAAVGALEGVLPSVRVEAGYVRTTDPIGAFGTTLRQRRIGSADFDPARLNQPPAALNYAGGLVVEQPLLNLDAWRGRDAARSGVRAAAAQVDWARTTARLEVVKGWFGGIVAAEQVATLATAQAAALAHVRQAESMARNGLVTSSDAMLAAVRAGEVETQLLEARGAAVLARRALATAMGAPGDTAISLPSQLPDAAAIGALVARIAPSTDAPARADVRAASAELEAAGADRARARALMLPRLNGIARYDWNSRRLPFDGASNWTVGVMASWAPFGVAELSEDRAAAGRRAAAEAALDGARARASLELAQSTTALETAQARLAIAERSVRQAGDAHRIVARKYDGGLATITELLDAAAAETRARLADSAARHQLIVALAERYRAEGGDPGIVATLDPSSR